MLIDTHAHLAASQFTDDLPAVIDRAAEAGVTRIITIGSDLEDSARNLEIAEEFSGVYAAVGVHPTSVHEVTESDWVDRLRNMAAHSKVVAIGEIGLDFFHPPRDGSSNDEWRARQERFFRAQLDLAEELALPTVIHQRECIEEVGTVLADYAGRVRSVVHCFTGTPEQMQAILEMENLISFTGIVTFPKALDVKESATEVPDDRLMVETDAPYLAPVPFRGKRCEPAHVLHTSNHIAELRGLDATNFANLTTRNAETFFQLPEV